MRIPSNKIGDIKRFFLDELKGEYAIGEIETFIAYCFEAYVNMSLSDLSLKNDDTVSESDLLKFNFAVKDLKAGKPIQHILGEADFYGLKFSVNEHVLIPRQETEELVHMIIKESKGSLSILDMGTGSGCIPIALKKEMPNAKVTAIDISDKALELAKENAQLNKVDINFQQYDILSKKNLTPKYQFDIIVSNPPYVRNIEKVDMHTNVLNYEPHLALFVDDKSPLLYYDAIADFAIKNLAPNGKVYFEINEFLGPETKELLEDKGFKGVLLVKDMNGKNRILRGNI